MKILHVVNISFVLPYFIGDQFDYFKRKGATIFVACTPSSHFQSYSQEKGFIPVETNILRKFNLIADIKSIYKLRKLILDEEIDVIIGHTPKGGLVAMIASYLARKKRRVYFRHGLVYETSSGSKRFILKNVERLTGKLATKVVCVSRSIIERSNEDRLNNPSKNILLNEGSCNGINIGKFSLKNFSVQRVTVQKNLNGISLNDTVVGYVGRLVKDKGISELLKAWRVLEQRYENVKLLLVGPFEDRDSIEELDKIYIKESKTIIHTGLQYETVDFYSIMDIFILPSYREGFPQVILEASAMHLPIITTKSTGCINAIIDGKTGIYTEIIPTDIIDKIAYYIDNPLIRAEHGNIGRLFVENNYDQEVIWKEIELKILDKL